MLTSSDVHKKSSVVCITARSTPASLLSFKLRPGNRAHNFIMVYCPIKKAKETITLRATLLTNGNNSCLIMKCFVALSVYECQKNTVKKKKTICVFKP